MTLLNFVSGGFKIRLMPKLLNLDNVCCFFWDSVYYHLCNIAIILKKILLFNPLGKLAGRAI